MTFDAGNAWRALGANGLLDRDGEVQAWRFLLNQTSSYPTGKHIPPLRPPRRSDKARLLAVFDWTYDQSEVMLAKATALAWCADGEHGSLSFTSMDESPCALLIALITSPIFKQRTIAAWGAADAGFHSFLRQFAKPLVLAGFTIEPVATGTRCKALILRKGRRTWWLTDAQEMTGANAFGRELFETEYAPRSPFTHGTPMRLHAAMDSFQRSLLSLFGVCLRPTIGGSALRAAQQHVSSKAWLWRPSPILTTMCRQGMAMRGGYSYAERYDGQAYQADINKAYTGALAQGLPARLAFTANGNNSERVAGIYLCKVYGPGAFPIYIGRFAGDANGFELEYWNGKECYCILASSEINGIRAMGFTVDTRGGFAFTRLWSLAPFVRTIESVCAQFGRGSAHERTAKLIGNTVYGKLAERPERDEVMYAEKRPAPEWHPMVTLDGDEVPFLWTRQVTEYKPGQHVDVAAHVTGAVRGKLYEAMAVVDAMGGRVVHADTDGLISTVTPAQFLDTDDTRAGAWRITADTQRAMVWGRKGSAFGDEIRSAGISGLTTDDAAQLAAGQTLETRYMQRGAAWGNAAPLAAATRRARATA